MSQKNKPINFLQYFAFLFLLVSVSSLQTFARAGDLDVTFDNDGIVTRQFFVNFNLTPVTANAIQADGKIVFASTGVVPVTGGSTDGYTVIRYNSNGSLDSTFGTGGVVNTNVGNFEGLVTVLIQPDGKIILSGERYAGETRTDFAVLRYNANGTLDNSFDGNGLAVATFSAFSEERWGAAALQPDGKIVVVGQTDNATENTSYDWAIVRFNSDGSLDTSFDGDGKLALSLGGDTESAKSVDIQQDGKIIVSGVSNNGTDNDFTTIRLNSNGSLDQNFGANGIVRTQFGNFNEDAASVKIQSDSKILVAGGASNGTNSDIALARYNANGTLDSSFGTNGLVTASYTSTSDENTYSMVLQQDNKIVVSSKYGINAGAVRFNGDGTLDNSFGNGGKTFTQIFNFTSAVAYSTAIQNDGKIVISGVAPSQSGGSTYYFTLRYIGAANFKSPYDFDGDGKTDISIFRPSGGEWWYQRSSNNQVTALQFGESTDKIVPGDYTGDGKTDIAFFRPSTGQWFILRSEDYSFYAFPFGAGGDIPAPGDYDGDGKVDPTVFRPSNGVWYTSKSTGGVSIEQFGLNGDIPIATDYDGDGKADIGVFRPSTGGWWINRSNSSLLAVTFGDGADKPVSGDYTGDGKADVAFFRPSTGQWFVLRSENFSFYGAPFGAAGDVPVPGDYDGDGRFDFAVFRSSNSGWYISRSTAGVISQQFGFSTDQPVPSAFIP